MKILYNRIILAILSMWCICLNVNGQTNPSMRPDSAAAARIESNMVAIEEGSYMMGCNGNPDMAQSSCAGVEQPAHKVKVFRFKLCKYLVTQDEWKAIMGSYPKTYTGCGECPVDNVSFQDAWLFINKLRELTGKDYRYPTEEEWEFAARGGNLSRGYLYPGSNNLDSVAWYRRNSGGHTHPVGQKAPNELGLYDMKGNVIEWCSTQFTFYNGAWVPNTVGFVLRGSTCLDDAWACRITWRSGSEGWSHKSNYGFRLAENIYIPDSAAAAKIESNMVTIQAGPYVMGCNSPRWWEKDNGDCSILAQPAHQVSVGTFKICKYVVTQADWKAVMGVYPNDFKGCEDCPEIRARFQDAQAFIEKLNKLTGRHYRLPTEEEWEFAARGGNLSRGYKYPGSDNPDEVAWYKNNSGGQTHPVGLKAPNELGLYDMAGNVKQWCNTLWKYYSQTSPEDKDDYVIRGSNYGEEAQGCIITDRMNAGLQHTFGFRIAED